VAALDVTVTDGRGRGVPARGLARWLAGVAPRHARGEVSVAVVSDARVRRLNSTYRGIDRVTDVLSFPAEPPAASDSRPSPARSRRSRRAQPVDDFLGDVVIARGQAMRQAVALGHPLWVELRVLALHGLLHLLGYDHDVDAGEMARLEARLRQKGGLAAGLIERERGR
jgi:probable rRNA maturation factor